MLRGEHDKSHSRSSFALDRDMPSRVEYLVLIITIIQTISHVRIWSFYAAEPS